MSIDAKENEVLSWAVKLCDFKEAAESAYQSGNLARGNQLKGEADAARTKLRSLGYSFVADALSADGATAAQARKYVQALRNHLYQYSPGSTPPLTLQAALAGSSTTTPGDLLGGIGDLVGNAGAISQGARAEATGWVDILKAAVIAALPFAALYYGSKIFRIKLGR